MKRHIIGLDLVTADEESARTVRGAVSKVLESGTYDVCDFTADVTDTGEEEREREVVVGTAEAVRGILERLVELGWTTKPEPDAVDGSDKSE